MIASRLILLLAGTALIVACSKEPPPRSVAEFMENPILLEAALVRCTQNRAETRYDSECINAREAVKLIEAKEEAKRREELEAQSKRKRDALRRTQQAAAEARRRAAEARRKREEAAYIAQFGEPPPSANQGDDPGPGNEPIAVIPETVDEAPESGSTVAPLPPAGNNAPVVAAEPQEEPPPAVDEAPANDLAAIRDELKRRNNDGNE